MANPKIWLAPMQGLVDPVMRDVLTRIGGYDFCVTEFVRITHTVHGRSVWFKNMPELATDCRTRGGAQVVVQLLGSDAPNMLANALRAVEAGARRIDLNFGCPAPTVNRHSGGAVLLREPQRIENIVRTLRLGLPENIILTAKMRLGYEDKSLALDCARAIENGGANGLAVHARTKVEGYRPPAHWDWLGKIHHAVSLPLVANGDIFSLQDYQRLVEMADFSGVMIGRGAVMMPDLGRQIAQVVAGQNPVPMDWEEILPFVADFFELCRRHAPEGKYPAARLKQWLGMMRQQYAEARRLFDTVRPLTDVQDIAHILQKAV